MIIPDINLLVYAHDRDSPYHKKSHSWLVKALLNPQESVGISSVVSLGFIRLAISPHIFKNSLSLEQAEDSVASWFKNGAIRIDATAEHFSIFFRLMQQAHGSASLTTDAHIAALSLEHNGTVYSNDNDFLRFKGLRFVKPLQ